MHLCSAHWTAARTAIEARGMAHLVPALTDGIVSAFEPVNLLTALVTEVLVLALGPSAMFDDGCQVCALTAWDGHLDLGDYATRERALIEGSADEVLRRAQALGVLGVA